MKAFLIGMLATGLWLVVAAAALLLMRSSPGHPFRTIQRFRRVRRSLASATAAPAPSVPHPPGPAIHLAESGKAAFRPGRREAAPLRVDLTATGSEVAEIHSLIASITSERRAPAPAPREAVIPSEKGAPPRPRTAAAGSPAPALRSRATPRRPETPRSSRPRTAREEGIPYVVVDEDGRPILG